MVRSDEVIAFLKKNCLSSDMRTSVDRLSTFDPLVQTFDYLTKLTFRY